MAPRGTRPCRTWPTLRVITPFLATLHGRCCSIDGDADRLVYFSPEPPCTPAPAEHGGEGDGSSSGKGGGGGSGGISLLDGDKVAILAAVFIRDLMDQLPAELLQGVQVGRSKRDCSQDLLVCTWSWHGDWQADVLWSGSRV